MATVKDDATHIKGVHADSGGPTPTARERQISRREVQPCDVGGSGGSGQTSSGPSPEAHVANWKLFKHDTHPKVLSRNGADRS